MITDKKIRTEHIRPPIPTNKFDWHAWIDGEEETGVGGYGATEAAAIAELKELIEDES